MQVRLVKPTGVLIERPTGFSWTTLLFGLFPAMFRGDWKFALIQLVAALFTCGVSTILFAFKYNKWHLEEMLEKGCKAADETTHLKLINMGLVSPAQPFEGHLV